MLYRDDGFISKSRPSTARGFGSACSPIVDTQELQVTAHGISFSQGLAFSALSVVRR